MRARRVRRHRRATLGILAVLLWLVPTLLMTIAHAGDAVSCSFSGGVLAITSAGSDTIEIARDAAGSISVSGCPPTGATVANTAAITITGDGSDQDVVIQLEGGYGSINWTINVDRGSDQTLGLAAGFAGANVAVGASGIDLDGNGDLDVTAAGVQRLRLTGGSANDTLSAGGSVATGAPTAIPVTIEGGDGNDVLTGGSANDFLDGGGGTDDLDGGLGDNDCVGGETTTNCGTAPAAPRIDLIDPSSGSVAGDTPLSIIGSGFTQDAVVTFDGQAVVSQLVSATELSVSSPPHDAGPALVVVTVDGTASEPVEFTYFAESPTPTPSPEVPTISTLSPTSGPTDENTLVTIIGSGFTPQAVTSFDGIRVQPTFVSSTELQVETPPHGAGVVNVTVTVGGVVSEPAEFEYTEEPPPPVAVVSRIEPASGPISGGTVVTISGTGFTPDDIVLFGDIAVEPTFVSEVELQAIAPAHPAGTVHITVVGPGGESAISDPDIFAFTASPAVADTEWTSSVPTPADVSWNAGVFFVSLGLAALLLFLIPYPAEKFNTTLEAHYDEITHPFDRFRSKGEAGPLKRWLVYVLAILATALLTSWLDPSFRLDSSGRATYLGLVVALVFVTLMFGLARDLFMRRLGIKGMIRSFGWGLIIAAACVVISRLVRFQPGYLYGAIAGIGYAATLDEAVEGRKEALSSAWVLLLTLGVWFARIPVEHAMTEDPSDLALTATNVALTAVFVAGVETLAFGLLPVKRFPGLALRSWSRTTWGLLLSLGFVGFVYLLANPSWGYQTTTPIVTTIVLFCAFALGSYLFAAYFERRGPRGQDERVSAEP